MELKEFNFDTTKIRSAIDEKGEPWFVANDVMSVLGIKYQRHALRKLDEDERGGVELPGDEGKRNFATINESGLYSLILQSNKSETKRFKKWITSEVLPSIRKTGQYSVQTLPSVVEMGPLERLEAHVAAMRHQAGQIERQQKEINIVSTALLEVAQEARQENDTLTHDQISELDGLINNRYKDFGDVRNVGMMRKAIKEHFFKIKGSRTYKEIPRSGFEVAKQIVAHYQAPRHLNKSKDN